MRKVKLYIAMSLDGYIANKLGGVDWLTGDGSEPENLGSYADFYKTIDTVVMGRTLFNQITTELAPGNWPYKTCMTYVFTHHPEEIADNIKCVSKDIQIFLEELREQKGNDIWICGGANIANQFLRAGLIDEVTVTIVPTILGDGIPLFQKTDTEMKLKLVSTKSYNGLVDLVYQLKQ